MGLFDFKFDLDDIQHSLESTVKGAFRIAETAGTLAGTGLSWVLGNRPPAPALMRSTFEKLGSTYIKLGQFIASSPSLFPAEYVEEFQKCLDQTEPLPYKAIREILVRELGHNLSEIFESIEERPLASASIAQVHGARLKNGIDVVLKVQKPGVDDILLTDLNFLFVAARVMEMIAPGFARTSLSGIIDDIQKTMMEECDFLREARNIKEFQRFLEESNIREAATPKVYDQYTTRHVLTMERFYGVPLTDLESIRKYTNNPELTLITALNTWFASLMLCNFFHADVHAGNLMVLDDGRVGFIDFGIVGRIRKNTWEAMNKLMEGMANEDFQLMAESMAGIGATDENVDVNAFARDLEKLFRGMEDFERYVRTNQQLDENEMNRIMIDMVQLGEKHGIRFPREFALLIKQFLYFDRYIKILAPELDMFADSRLNRLVHDDSISNRLT